jgi:hypothetical protein
MMTCRFARHPSIVIRIEQVELDGVAGHPVWCGEAYEHDKPARGIETNARGRRYETAIPARLGSIGGDGLGRLLDAMLAELDERRAQWCA